MKDRTRNEGGRFTESVMKAEDIAKMVRMRRNHVSMLSIAKDLRLNKDTVTRVLREQMSEAEWGSLCSGVKSRAAADSHVAKTKKQPTFDRVDLMRQSYVMRLF